MSWIKPAFGEDGSSCASPAKTSKISNISKTETKNTIHDTDLATNWLEAYKPKCSKELVVNITKIKELKQWLQKSMNFKSTSKLLLITGPSGSGKTSTFNIICKDLELRIIEWITPLDRLASGFESSTNFEHPVSVAQLFKEHIFRAARYNSCLQQNSSRHVVLVKDFPNVLIQSPSVLHDILGTFYGSYMFPIVFICNSNYYCNELFPHFIKGKFGIFTITFNPITNMNVFKVLKSIVSRRSYTNLKETPIPDNILYHISHSCQGDLRNAISRLYLKSVKTSIQFKKNKKVKMEPIEMVTKDESVDFFHGVGRVLYPKRIESDKGLKFVHSAEAIVENFESEPGGFLSQLHENYPSRMGDIEDLSEAAVRLANSDILRSRWQDREVFNHYSLAVAVRALMVTNRSPQKTKFEAFRKLHTSRMEVDIKAVELEGKTLFNDLEFTNYSYLIDVLPFASQLMSNLCREQTEYVYKTCIFNKK